MKTYPLLFEPGEGWMYGSGTDWAGEAIARVNSTTLEEFMRANIWEPLGMTSTTFHPELHPGMMERLVAMYERTDDHGLERGAWLSRIPARHDCGGHGLWSTTAHDWTESSSAWCLRTADPSLSKASIDEIFKPQTVGSSDLQELLTGPLRASLRSTVDMAPAASRSLWAAHCTWTPSPASDQWARYNGQAVRTCSGGLTGPRAWRRRRFHAGYLAGRRQVRGVNERV